MKKISKGQLRLILFGVTVVLGFCGTFIYMESKSQKEKDLVKTELLGKTDNLEVLDRAINQLFDSKEDDFVVKDLKKEQVDDLKKQVTNGLQLKDTNVLPKIDYAAFNRQAKQVKVDCTKLETAYNAQASINRLYQNKENQVAMNGTRLNKDLPIADDLTETTVDQVKMTYFKQEATTTYEKTLNTFIETAENQVTQIKNAQAAVAKVSNGKQVVSTDRQLYATAKLEIDKIKNNKAKQALINQLANANETKE